MSVELADRPGLRERQYRIAVRGQPLHHADLGSCVPVNLGECRNLN
jgi:hypothetical protein